MSNLVRRLICCVAGLLLIPGSVPAAEHSAVNAPLILLLIDNSLASAALVEQRMPWQGGQDYPGCFAGDRLYLQAFDQLPACTDPAHRPAAGNYCAAAGPALATFGRYDDALLGFDEATGIWSQAAALSEGSLLECRADRGLHGQRAGAWYAASYSGQPWLDHPAAEPDWGSMRTLYAGNWLNWRAQASRIHAPALPALKDAARALLAGMPGARFGLLASNSTPLLRAQPDQPRATLLADLEALAATGTSSPAAAIEAAASLLDHLGDNCSSGHIVLLTAAPPATPLPASGRHQLHVLQLAPGPLADSHYEAIDTGRLVAAISQPVLPAATAVSLSMPALQLPGPEAMHHDGILYLGMGQPTASARWPGNLKKYRLLDGRLLDQDGRTAFDPQSGSWLATAQSYWSMHSDGGQLGSGGAASRLPQTRRLYSNLAGGELWQAHNHLQAGNERLAAAFPELDPAELAGLLAWLSRSGSGGTFGDTSSSRPVIAAYEDTGSSFALVFAASNDGLLHAIDVDSGIERWAFMPARLLARLPELALDAPAHTRSYGLDGELRLVQQSDAAGRSRQLLLAGMGRGGSALFALDVSDPDRPLLLWERSRASAGFQALGQRRSAPVAAHILVGGQPRPVLLLSGGEDDRYRSTGELPGGHGDALYLMDLYSGELLLSAGADPGHALQLPEMRYPVAGAPRPVDLGGDGLSERIYLADTAGQLWRFDIQQSGPLLRAHLLATLGRTARDATPSDDRRFHTSPDVVRMDHGHSLRINLGSGDPAALSSDIVQDGFFSILDSTAPLPASSVPPLTLADLRQSDGSTAGAAEPGSWWLPLLAQPGERVLHQSITLRKRLMFSSTAPRPAADDCSPAGFSNRFYELELEDGRLLAANDTGTGDASMPGPAARTLAHAGPGARLQLLFGPGEDGIELSACIGAECLPLDPALAAPRPTWWYPGAP